MISKLGKSKLLKCPARSALRRYRVQTVTSSWRTVGLRSDSCPFKGSAASEFVKPVFSYSNLILKRYGSTEGQLDKLKFESVCADTLDSLTEYFEELVETVPEFKNGDVTYSDGVLTVQLGKYGTYVINRQSPNLQIWLSSPKSGPKRYDFVNGTWVYKHDRTTLHSLLDRELNDLIQIEVEFTRRCAYSKVNDS